MGVWYTYCADRNKVVNRRVALKSFECRDGGVPCDAKVTGETDDEVLAKAVEHARDVHGVDLAASSTLAGYARSLIRDDGETQAR